MVDEIENVVKEEVQPVEEPVEEQAEGQKEKKAKKSKVAKEVPKTDFKIFNRWSFQGVEVKDPGVRDYINITPVLVPRISHGRHAKHQFHKSHMNIVERLMNHLFSPGHRGKRHKITSGTAAGSSEHGYRIMLNTFLEIEKREKANPIAVLVKALENSALTEEVSSYQIGSIIVRKAVVTSPQRRVDLSLRLFVQGAYGRKFNKKKGMAVALAEEIIAAYKGSKDSYAIAEKERQEREASGAR